MPAIPSDKDRLFLDLAGSFAAPVTAFAEDPRLVRGEELSVSEALMGDIIRPGAVAMRLAAEVVGTAPIERLDVLHGAKVMQTARAFTAADLGRRVRVTWQGAEYRGRGRETMWQGKLTLANNRFARFAPVNFLNAERKVEEASAGRRISVYRLPEQDWSRRLSVDHVVTFPGGADLPVYVRVTQNDGHQAWSSPIYLIA